MLPKKLIIKGLYSYQEEQEIDFEKLTDAGIFGIFGPVGSGKSSILEAIGFALYGKTERLGEKENRNYNMMNLKSNQLLVDFEFSNFDGDLYRFMVEGKRNSRRFEDVNTFKRRAFKWESNDWLPLESTDATPIIGLSYDNFRRSIIIPQGKFQEFIQLGNTERTRMMMDIFHLHKYDLSSNIKALDDENNLVLADLEGQLKSYGSVSEEIILALKKNLESKLEEENSNKNHLLLQELEWNKLSELKQKMEQWEMAKNELAVLQKSQEDFEKRQVKLNQYKNAKLNFESDFQAREKLNDSLNRDNTKSTETTLLKKKANDDLRTFASTFEKLLPEYNSLDTKREQLSAFIIAQEALEYKSHSERILKELQHIQTDIKEVASFKKNLSEEIAGLSSFISSKNINKSDEILKFNNLNNWFISYNNLSLQHSKVKNEISDYDKRITNGLEYFAKLSLSFEHWEVETDKINKDISNKKKLLEGQLRALETQKELHQYALNLQEGDACPLCGATHHPELLKDKNSILIEYQNIIKKLEEQNVRSELLASRIKDAIKFEAGIKQFQNSREQKIAEISTIELQLQKAIKDFKWIEFNYLDENDFKNKYALFLKELKELEEKEKELRSKQLHLDEINTRWQQLQNKQTSLQTQYESQKDHYQKTVEKLAVFNSVQLVSLDNQTLLSEHGNLAKQIISIQDQYESLNKNINDLEKTIAVYTNQINTFESNILEKEKELNKLILNIKYNLIKFNIEEETIVELLKEPLAIEEEEQAILLFQNKLFAAVQKEKQYDVELNDKVFDLEKWNELTQTITQLKTTQNELGKIIAQLQHEIKYNTEKLEKSKLIQLSIDQKLIRKENINELRKLFLGNGFVNYVSSVYLKNLCLLANIRFMKLTNNHLQLELSDQNEFLIRDMVNDGKMRSAKTLSGGQIFQASLTLALALADSIYHQQKSQQNFFFLDEGFGSLDNESLSIIFDTLKSLRKENRIVGIISHVEELQQEIPISLNIINDPEKGSIVSYN